MAVRASSLVLALGAWALLEAACGSRMERGHPPPPGWKAASPPEDAGDHSSDGELAGAPGSAGNAAGSAGNAAGAAGESSAGGAGGASGPTGSGGADEWLDGGAAGQAGANGNEPLLKPGIEVITRGQLIASEWCCPAKFSVVLLSPPTASVTIALTSSKPERATVEPPQLVFTPLDWSMAQTVTVSASNDDIADGTQPLRVFTEPAQSDDELYAGLDAADVDVSIHDNDDSGITTGAPQGNTSEAGGSTTFWLVLNSRPKATVTIRLTSSDSGEGSVPESITIEPEMWNAPHTITVTGVDDDETDGNQPYSVKVGPTESTDPAYAGRVMNVALTNLDDDS